MDQQNQGLFDLHLDQQSFVNLKEAAKWARFIAIIGFIISALMVLFALFAGTLLSTMGAGFGEADLDQPPALGFQFLQLRRQLGEGSRSKPGALLGHGLTKDRGNWAKGGFGCTPARNLASCAGAFRLAPSPFPLPSSVFRLRLLS